MAAPAPGGIRFGNYVLQRRIARGGMAEVFLAQQRGLEGFDRRVAVKRILPHLAGAPDFVKMFLGEAKLAAALSHPNIVHIYDFGKHDGDYFIAMEFVDGVHAGDLFRIAEKEKLPPALVARVGADAATALHHAHELRGGDGKPLGLVHRDVSPANIMVSYDGVAKLCDFGIAKAAALGEQMTSPGQVKGKYAYMSPEQTTASQLDGRSDVFSLGIVLWELLAGRTIVGRSDAVESMRAIRDGKLPPIDKVAPKTPSGLAKAINWAMQTDREKRATALQFASALEAYIKSSPDLATPLHLGMWIRARFPRELEVSGALPSDVIARAAANAPKRSSATQIVDGTMQADLTAMPAVDGLREPTEDLDDPHSERETADLREHIHKLRADLARSGDSLARPVDSLVRPVDSLARPVDSLARPVDSLARPVDSLEQRAPFALPETPESSRDSLGSISHTAPLERQGDAFDGAATLSTTDEAPPMYLRDGGDPFAPGKETDVDEARPAPAWSGFEPEAGAYATHPQRGPRSPSNASPSNASPSNAVPSNAVASNASPSNASSSNASPSNAWSSNASPSNAVPSNASRSNASPSNASSANASPSNASSSNASPSNALLSNASSSNALPSNAVPPNVRSNHPASTSRAPSSPANLQPNPDAPLTLDEVETRSPSASRAPSSPSAAPPSRPHTSSRAPSSPSAAPPTPPSRPHTSSRAPSSPSAATPIRAAPLTLDQPPDRAAPFATSPNHAAPLTLDETPDRAAPFAASPNRAAPRTLEEAAPRTPSMSSAPPSRSASPAAPPPRSPTLPPPRSPTLPPPHRTNTPVRNVAVPPYPHSTADSTGELRNAESVGLIPLPTAIEAALRPRSPTINPQPLPPRAADPSFDPQPPFAGDQSGELISPATPPTPPEQSAAHAQLARATGAAPSAIPGPLTNAGYSGPMPAAPFPNAGYSGPMTAAPSMNAGYSGPMTAAPSMNTAPPTLTAPPLGEPLPREMQLQPSRRTVAIGGFIAVAVVVFAAALAVHSCNDQHATTSTSGSAHGAANESANGSANGSANDTGSARKSGPSVEPIGPTVEPITE
ncbi:MAG TPA: protein kinase [Kofleriaceae bacterium]